MRATLLLPLFVAIVGSPALASDKTYQNDSIAAGGSGSVQAGFVKNEIAAAVFTVPPVDGTVFLQRARILIFNALGQTTSRQCRILVYPTGTVNPGAPIYTSPIFVFLPGGENLVDLSSANIELAVGQSFTIGVRFEQEGLFVNFTSVVTDVDGIQPGKNRIFNVSTNSWQTAESVGITGDFGIRCDVTPNGPVHYGAGTGGINGVPTLDTTGAWKMGNPSFAITGTNGPSSAIAFFGVAGASASIPIFGITILIDPATTGAFTAPTGPTGSWSLTTGVPADPAIVGLHFFGQVYFVDAGSPQGISCSDGIDILVASP